jgi:hypothetical protein
MYHKPLFIVLLVLALATMACGLTINLPVDQITTGPTQVEDIKIAEPDAKSAAVKLSFGAGQLRLEPGAQGSLITGTATYNVPDFKPVTSVTGNQVSLSTGNLEIKGIPNISNDIKNEWDLKFGELPMDLSINAGAYQGNFELGGLALTSLEVNDGASDVSMKFSETNRVDMESFHYTTGASNVRLSGLGYANFSSMVFRSGAGDYTLDFTGQLKRPASVTVESGISQVVIIVPKGMSVEVNFTGGLANINTSGDWHRSGDRYSLSGSGPLLTINVSMGAGNLELRAEG